MSPREYSTRARAGPAGPTVADVMVAAATLARGGRGRFLAPPVLQSWPGIVHGGGLVALLDAVAATLGQGAGPRRIDGRLTSSVPLATPLDLEGYAEDGAATITILDRAQPLASATITRAIEETTPDPAGAPSGRDSWPMPLSDHCLACGALNPIGLRLGLRFDADGVWARFLPREPWRRSGDRLDPALPAVVLDEVAWWLGALATKEGGLTNRISLTLLRPDAAVPGEVTAVGRFADVTPVDRRGIFWRTRSALLGADRAPLATAVIVFRAGADYSSRQMGFFRSRTDPEVFARMFPSYRGEGSR